MIESIRCACHTYPLSGLIMKAIGMFHVKQLPDEINESLLMLYLYCTGMAGIYRENGKWHYGYAGYCGNIHEDGTGSRVIVTNFTKVKEMPVEDCAVIWLNALRYPMWDTWERYNKFLVEGDISLNCVIQNTRSTRVPVARNDIEKAQYDELFKAQSQGRRYVPTAPVSNLVDNFNIIDLGYSKGTTPISEIMDMRKRIIAEYDNELGIGVFDGIKKERMITDELNNVMSSSRINVQGMFNEISKWLDRANQKLGTEMELEYSEAYRYINADNMGGDSSAENQEEGSDDNPDNTADNAG